jgi:hypothetical protein
MVNASQIVGLFASPIADPSPTFGTSSAGGGSFRLRGASYGTETTTPYPGTWSNGDFMRLRLIIDPDANGGDGLMTLQATNLTLDDGIWITPLSNIDAQLTDLGAYSTPDTWNGLFLRVGGGPGIMIDNLTIEQIPEPMTISLLALGALFLYRRRR